MREKLQPQLQSTKHKLSQAHNAGTWEAETGRSRIGGQAS